MAEQWRWTADEVAALMDRYAGVLQLYVGAWTCDSADVAQEAFIELIRLPRPPEQIGAWLFTVARRRAMNASRARQRRERHERQAARLRPADCMPANGGALDADEALSALNQLDGPLREVIVARIWGPLTLAQIAELTGASLSTVHRRYQMGIEQLRNRLGDPCDNPQSTTIPPLNPGTNWPLG